MTLPSEDQMQFCVMTDGSIVDGAGGLAIGGTEDEAWTRAYGTSQDWAVEEAKRYGAKIARCAIMVINP